MQNNNPQEIAARVREMREVLELNPVDIASRLGITAELYGKYESGEVSIPISKLYLLADIFKVDFTVLMTGEQPRMLDYTLVRDGQGIKVDRYPGYSFQSLAFNYIGRTMEPLIVLLDPDSAVAPLVTHEGQEFNLVLEGTVRVTVGTHEFFLNKGDSCYFNPTIPHGQHAIGGPAKFLTIIERG